MEQPIRKLDFTQDMERKAIKAIAQDPGFVLYWLDRLNEHHFNYPWNMILFRVVKDYYTKRKVLPTLEIIDQEVQKYLTPDDSITGFHQYFSELFSVAQNLDETEYVKDILIQHMKQVDYDRFLFKYSELNRDGKLDEIEKAFNEMRKKHVMTKNEVAYLEPGETVVERVNRERTLVAAVPSPWQTYNANSSGGFHHGTITAFMGPTGSGKSLLLVNAGSHLLKNKKTVYHFTFELDRGKTMARYDVCLSGATYKEREANPGIVDQSLKKLGLGDLHVIEYPTDTCSANKIRATIDDYVARGCKKPDVIIIDYLTIMLPNCKDDVDMKNEYSMLKQVAEDVRALAMDPSYGKPPIITAFQSNRGSELKTSVGNEVKKGDISDSYAVMGVMDAVMSINQSAAEKDAAKMRLYVAKARDAIDAYTVTCDVEYGNLQITEDTATTIRYQNAAKGAVENARKLGQIPTTLDPSSPGAALETMVGGLVPGHGPVPIIGFQNMSKVVEEIRRVSSADAPQPVVGRPIASPPPPIAATPPSEPPPPIEGEKT